MTNVKQEIEQRKQAIRELGSKKDRALQQALQLTAQVKAVRRILTKALATSLASVATAIGAEPASPSRKVGGKNVR